MILIPPNWRNYLVGSPEFGMGYQMARVRLATGVSETGFIFNASTFIESQELNTASPLGLWTAELKLRNQIAYITISDITLIPRSLESLRGVRRVSSTQFSNAYNENLVIKAARSSEGAKDAPITSTAKNEIFKRFSAYVDDFRITEKRGLKAGTFGTTAEDAENVKTGRDAVRRYAIENKQSANKRFTISPAEYTRLQRGIAEPAYGEPGGGVEVIFVDGTTDNTVSTPDILPEE